MNAWQIKDATDEYDWWWHNMTGFENGDPSKPRSFFMEYFTINPGIKSKKADCWDPRKLLVML